ncbi:DtxR family transcriptional regulator, Mn-dependent transcriptional regulator [Desulfonatronum thiosulfatophilum]|uniref:DtxR family transcriptional regulator, Mn-dependent transcriptional regulator n=1 Tax=Desulfonatronum thiosulfatophilum TaxID=617002 RepID=A0A1G6E6V6_9BACT|nr:metal-dependent transcriptional regulator [Desulfonatronum thiosulfatophilum]SDB53214.1 DtxR family transcriptional regulator, Mn-dependent transcriptional regulator [Desulfonatronum thiosulfatophilum]
MEHKHEEILEAVLCASENGKYALDDVRKHCCVDFSDEDIAELERQGLLVSSEGKILFSQEGKAHAEKIMRRHRLAEVLLKSILKLKNSEMEKIACEVEHALLPEVEESICTLLGHPEVCPDGKPIPKGPCCHAGQRTISNTVVGLNELQPGEKGAITYIKPGSHSNLQQLISLGLNPGVVVTVHRRTPAFCIKYEQTELALDDEIAKNIFVWKVLGGESNRSPTN